MPRPVRGRANHPDDHDHSDADPRGVESAGGAVEVDRQRDRVQRAASVRDDLVPGARLVEGYGLTEASPVTHCVPLSGEHAPGTIGVPLPSTDAAIFDQEAGRRRLGPGEVGELAVRGPQVMQGYWKRPEDTAQVLREAGYSAAQIRRMCSDGAAVDAGHAAEQLSEADEARAPPL